VEAGGTGTAGSDGTGNVLTNDTDPDSVVNGEARTVSALRTGTEAGSGTAGAVGTALAGTFGSLTLNADGSYTYVVDETNTAVQALRVTGQQLTDVFTYTMQDAGGLSDLAQLTLTIDGRNDAPVALDDTGSAVEAGGTANGTAGSDGTGNVLTNDTDPDSVVNGEARTVSALRTGTEAGSGTAGAVGAALAGTFGSLTLNADGSYTYVVDETNTAVQALRVTGQQLTDVFTYTMQDAGGLSDLAQLTLTIDGRNDAPVALDDTGSAVEAGGTANGTAGSDGTGNVLTNDTDPDSVVNGEARTVSALRTGTEAGSGTAGVVGAALAGTFGSLTLNADGSYTYLVDETNAVQALRVTGQQLTDVFTYTMQDAGGLSDLAQLTLTIDGRNDAPVALDDTASAVEAGGTANGTAGSDGTGNVLTNDTDPDSVVNGEARTVSALRTGTEAGSGTAGAVGAALAGTFGSLTLNADGSYTYVVDETNTAVQALRVTGQQLTDVFTYTMQDAGGLSTWRN
jgi:VCBS repeat-containing protein